MIRKKDLGRLDFIAEGGVGAVHRVPQCTLPGLPPLAYKELLPTLSSPDRRQALDSMTKAVAFRAALGPADRDDLDEYTTWPVDMVEDGGVPCGLVMPLIPPDFFLKTRPPGGAPGSVVFDLSWLSAKDSQAQVNGIDRSAVQDPLIRIALLAHLVYAVGRLHRHGAVYGDLSLKNAALAVNPPRVRLLDCDATAPLTDLTRVQLHSPFFKPPELISGTQSLQDDRTDVYKLGLCVIRGLQQGPGVSQTKSADGLVGILDAAAVDVIRRAVGTDRAQRPTARELFSCLEQALMDKASPPVVRSASLDRAVLVRGQDVQVSWDAAGAKQVRILGANGLEVMLPDPGRCPARRSVIPAASGDIVVEVVNRHGTAQAVAGTVSLYELPPFDVTTSGLPRPVVPGVPAVAIPAVLTALPAVPAMTAATHPVPRVVMPALDAVLDALRPLRTVLSPVARVDEAVLSAGRHIRSSLDPLTARGQGSLGSAVAGATRNVRAVFDHAVQDLRTRAARQRSATRP